MRKAIVLLLIATFAAGAALAHGGKSHKLLGTVKSLQENHLTVTSQDGHEAHVMLAKTTTYEQEGKPATRAALKPGVRVAIQLTEDDKTAVKVRIGAAPAAKAAAQVVDPVCGMKVDPRTAAGSSTHAGKTYWFCSKEEKAKFDKNPGAYLKKG